MATSDNVTRGNGSAKRAAAKHKRRVYDSMSDPPPPGAYKLRPAARYLSISVPSLRRLVARGEIKPNRELRHLLFKKSELERWLSK